MDLTTNYLGFELEHPLVPGASPLVDDLDTVRRLEDAGAPMIVMNSLFEEQIVREQVGTLSDMEEHAGAHAEALSYFPDPPQLTLGPERYLEQLRSIKEAVDVPVVASLNGVTAGGWLGYARQMAEAGADALELNLFDLPIEVEVDAPTIETRAVDAVKLVCEAVDLPVAVKLSPFYTSLPHLARQMEQAGATALVIFNRFYQPDIHVETMEVEPRLVLSSREELLLRLRWTAILSGRVDLELAITGGVETHEDVLKAVMAGAHCVQATSALLRHGPDHIRTVIASMRDWLEEHQVGRLADLRGSMSLARCPDPHAFTRANYMRILASWRG